MLKFSLMLIAALLIVGLISACGVLPSLVMIESSQTSGQSPEPVIEIIPVDTAAPVQPVQEIPAEPADPVIEPAPQSEPLVSNSGIVTADNLNLRLGPGLNHKVYRLLQTGDTFTALGRSQDSEWLLIELSNDVQGWVSSRFVKLESDMSLLPVQEAYGGPENSGQPQAEPTVQTQKYSLNMIIADNRAEIKIVRFPANTDLRVYLGPSGKQPDLWVAEAKTNANGATKVTFEMPGKWADGSPVTQTELTLLVVSTDGSYSQTASITYYH